MSGSAFSNAAAPDELEKLQGEALEAEYVGAGGSGPGAEPEPEPVGLGADACTALAGTVFELIAMRRGDMWRLAPDESQAVGQALDAVLAKYAPGIGDVGPEASLLLVTLAVVMPRVQAEKQSGAGDET